MSILTKILGGNTANVVDSLAKGLDNLVTTKEEKEQLRNELEGLFLKDRADARSLYKEDSSLQKSFALVFLTSYMLLTCAMLYFIYTLAFSNTIHIAELPDWAVAFLSTLFGAMSTKVSTITDFLFGGSKSNK